MPVALRPGEGWPLDFLSDTFGVSRKFRIRAVNDDCCHENLCPLSADCFASICQPIDGRDQHLRSARGS